MTVKSAPVVEVSRDTIVTAARNAIATARALGVIVSTSRVRQLMRTARTHDRFALGEWRMEGCGCLVGNLLGERLTNIELLAEPLYRVGIEFDRELSGLRGSDKFAPVPTILQVTS